MGTVAAPNLVIALIDLSTGGSDDGETVEVVLHGDSYPGDAVAVPEIGSSGKYKIETAGGNAALAQGIYEVYVGGTFKSVITHGYTGLQDHVVSVSDPHAVAAAQVAIVDAGGYISGSEVEAAIQELGAALAAKADASGTILTDNSDQSVNAAKPKVDNLDADQVDGADAGNSANNVLKLDSDGLVPLANIPDTLTGKNADSVDGADVGTGAGDIPQLSATEQAGKLDTTVLGKKVGGADDNIAQVAVGVADANKIHSTLLAKKVGAANDNIPQISTDDPPEAGKVHSSLLGMAAHRTASRNVGDSPAPDPTGGGSLWVEASVPNNTDQITLDANLDWKGRMILIKGYALEPANDTLPGGANDDTIEFDKNDALNDLSAGFYSQDGREGPGNAPGVDVDISATEDSLFFWVDASDGYLKCGKSATAFSTTFDLFLRVEYSPQQNH